MAAANGAGDVGDGLIRIGIFGQEELDQGGVLTGAVLHGQDLCHALGMGELGGQRVDGGGIERRRRRDEDLARSEETGRESRGDGVVGLRRRIVLRQFGQLVVGDLEIEDACGQGNQDDDAGQEDDAGALGNGRPHPFRAGPVCRVVRPGGRRPEEGGPEETEDRRHQCQGGEQHQAHADDEPWGEGAELADGGEQQRGEGEHDGDRSGHNDFTGPAHCDHEAFVRIRALGQLLAIAEDHEDDVVRADAEHHDDQEGRQLGADGKPEPLREAGREGSGHLVHQPDHEQWQERDGDAAEHQREQAQDQQHGGDGDDLLGPVEGRGLIDRNSSTPGELAVQARACQVGVGLCPQGLDRRVGPVLARLPVHGHLNQLHLLVLGQEQRRGGHRADRLDVMVVQRRGQRINLRQIGHREHGAVGRVDLNDARGRRHGREVADRDRLCLRRLVRRGQAVTRRGEAGERGGQGHEHNAGHDPGSNDVPAPGHDAFGQPPGHRSPPRPPRRRWRCVEYATSSSLRAVKATTLRDRCWPGVVQPRAMRSNTSAVSSGAATIMSWPHASSCVSQPAATAASANRPRLGSGGSVCAT